MTSYGATEDGPSYSRELQALIRAGENRRLVASVRGHRVAMDVRQEMGGDDTAPTPAEFLLISLGGCILNMARAMALEKDMTWEKLEVKVSGALDLEKAMGLPTSKRAGYSRIDVVLDFCGDAPAAEQDAFIRELIDRCPVCETILNGVPIHFNTDY